MSSSTKVRPFFDGGFSTMAFSFFKAPEGAVAFNDDGHFGEIFTMEIFLEEEPYFDLEESMAVFWFTKSLATCLKEV